MSTGVLVRVRPFSEKERALSINNTEQGPILFQSDPTSSSTAPVPHLSQAQRLGVPSQHRKILKVLDERILVFDPPDSNAVATFQKTNLPLQGKKVKDIRFCFDRVFDDNCGQEEVYEGSAKELVGHVMEGFHSTVFAYGVRYTLYSDNWSQKTALTVLNR
jgi:kinesin family protein 18/19